MPVKKVGSDTPAVTISRQSWSIQLPGLVAARTPSGMAMAQEKNSATKVNSSDAGSRAASSDVTGRPVDTDWPRSPCSSCPT